VYPVVLGSGDRLFESADEPVRLTLAGHDAYTNGVIHLDYAPA
jgi:dihydrofolate reductase